MNNFVGGIGCLLALALVIGVGYICIQFVLPLLIIIGAVFAVVYGISLLFR